MSAIKKGDRVRVISHEYDTTPDGQPNDGYGYGVTGVVTRFRTSQFEPGRIAVVHLDNVDVKEHPFGLFVDWPLSIIEKVTD